MGQVGHAVLVRPSGGERQLPGGSGVGEEPRAGTAGERVDEQVQLVDKAVREQRPTSVPLPETYRFPASSFKLRIVPGRTARVPRSSATSAQ
jgi:hypothetical protein